MQPKSSLCAVWSITHHTTVGSTQLLARDLPAWSAVWAEEQTAGRGQAERTFVSDPGGLYLTAVLPYDGNALASRGFALAVGWALCVTLRRVGLADVRLRWPNDLLVGCAKVGGILVEQGGPRTLLIGVGINLTNRPWVSDPALQGVAGRLADYVEAQDLPEPAELVAALLKAIRLAQRMFARRGLEGLAPVLGRCWGEARQVILEPAGRVVLSSNGGLFLGIDSQGAVRLRTAPGVETRVQSHHIYRLREVGETTANFSC